MSAHRKFCSEGGGGGGNPKKDPHKYKKNLPHAEKSAKRPQIIILLKYYIYLLQKKFSENVIQNAPNYTINKHSGQYMLQYIPLNIVRSITISLIFIKMNIFTIFFLQNCSKIHSRTHQIAPFFKIFSGEHAPEPPSKRIALPRSAWHKALCK